MPLQTTEGFGPSMIAYKEKLRKANARDKRVAVKSLCVPGTARSTPVKRSNLSKAIEMNGSENPAYKKPATRKNKRRPAKDKATAKMHEPSYWKRSFSV